MSLEEKYREVAKDVIYCPLTGEFFWKTPRKKRNMSKPIGTPNGKGYLRIVYQGSTLYLHRLAFLIMAGRLPLTVDHADRREWNNAWVNLREATYSENLFNRKLGRNKSGHPRVAKHRDRYVVLFKSGGVSYRQSFFTFEEAVVYEKANRMLLHKEFALGE